MRLEAMRDRARYACASAQHRHGNCPICAPVEDFECEWGGCRANAVTRVSFAGSSRHVCELHAPALAPSLLPAAPDYRRPAGARPRAAPAPDRGNEADVHAVICVSAPAGTTGPPAPSTSAPSASTN